MMLQTEKKKTKREKEKQILVTAWFHNDYTHGT